MNVRSVAISCAALILLLTSCSGAAENSDVRLDAPAGTPHASCEWVVSVDGEDWTGWPLHEDLTRETLGPEVQGTLTSCDDVGTAGEAMSPGQSTSVTLQASKGFSPKNVLYMLGQRGDNEVYVPGYGPEVTFDSLPNDVQELIRRG